MKNLIEYDKTQSTLLIPNRLVEDYLKKCEVSSREKYFLSLIQRYSPLIKSGFFGSRSGIKLRFQNEGENLIRKNFYPRNEDWTQFRLLSNYLGISMIALFTMLLTIDISEFPAILRDRWFDRGVPPTIAHVFAHDHLKRPGYAKFHQKIRFKILH